ncbi:hypothetical protein B0H10DRAFT_2229930 [Mycena sp. CBHHK59/15]|nr:hypothetical protein B0H10DRAFT_2229930 [Mycena sp. CBHHK59/15]
MFFFLLPPPPHTNPLCDTQPTSQVIPSRAPRHKYALPRMLHGNAAARGEDTAAASSNRAPAARTRGYLRSGVPDVRAEAHRYVPALPSPSPSLPTPLPPRTSVRASEDRRELRVSVLHHVTWCTHAACYLAVRREGAA